MRAIEELSDALLECLKDVSDLLDRGIAVADTQRDALISNDAEAIAISCTSYQEILRRLAQADERAAAVAAKMAEASGRADENINVESIIDDVDTPYAPLMSAELMRISELAKRLKDANEMNSALLNNGLEIIASCLRIVAQEPEPTVYSKQAAFSGSASNTLSLDWRV